MKKLLIALTMFLALWGCKEKVEQKENSHTRDGIRVKVEQIAYAKTNNQLRYSGSIEATVSTRLSFQTTGTVQHIYVEEGDAVREGQLIAEADKATIQSAYDAALAQYEQALDAQARLKKVHENGSLPEVKWVEINSQVAQAESQVKIYKENLKNCELRSPVDGIVGYRNLEVGMSALQMQAPISIISIDEVYVKIPVTEDEINKLKKGQLARVQVPAAGSYVFEGTVERIGVVANQLSRTYDVKIRVDNKNHSLKPGMVCSVDIEIPQTNDALLLPMEAVSGQTKGAPFVYVIDPKEKRAEKRHIELGGIINNKLQVHAGLSAGEIVVTYGKHKLTQNARVIY